MKILLPDNDGILESVGALRAGEVVAHPTETVYGFAVDPFSESALDRLFAVKEREPGKPVLLIVDDMEQVRGLAAVLPAEAVKCMEAFWPGPLSLLLPALPHLPARIQDNDGHVCVRCPAHPVARRLCREFGGPLTSTSANKAGAPPARAIADAALDGVCLGLDAGVLTDLPPSTVFDPVGKRILRVGPVTDAMLRDAGVL